MKKFVFRIFVFIFIFYTLSAERIEAKSSWPEGPKNVSAEGAIVMDAKSGMVLYEKNMGKKLYPASITKIMTTLLAIENSTLSETVKYSADAVLGLESGASSIGLKVGEKLTMEQSLYAIMLPSANEACLGVAEHIAGSVSAFAKQMNARAKSLGCKNTQFVNPNGLWNAKHYTTPYDMALIMREAMKSDVFRTIAGSKRYDIPKTNKSTPRPVAHHHKMIFPFEYPQYGYEYALAGKTGYTFKSGATLVTYAKKDDMELICVVMKTKSAAQGTPNVYTDTIKLFDYCFEKFNQYTIDDSVASQITKDYLFTKFSPYFQHDNPVLALDGTGSVILPNRVPIEKAMKKVEYFAEPHSENGKKVIGKLSYLYDGREAGGANILYNDAGGTTMLTDSLDMNEWVEETVEKANKPAFPWKNVLLIVLGSALMAAVLSVLVLRINMIRLKRKARKNYKKAETASHSEILFKKKK